MRLELLPMERNEEHFEFALAVKQQEVAENCE